MSGGELRELWLLRHAQAAHPEPGQRDFDRPLTRAGRSQCDVVAERLRKALAARPGGAPAIRIRVSPAVRARQTANAVLQDWFGGSVETDERIWEASAARLWALARESFGALLLVGHNPGLEQLQYTLTGEFRPLPTAGLVALALTPDGPAPARATLRFQPETASR